MIGQVINHRYELTEKVGQGSLFSVFKAKDRLVNRIVVVKLLQPQFIRNQGFVAGLKAGAESTLNLTHPNIARLLGTGEDGDSFYLVMEYVRGENLEEKLKRDAPLTYREALALAAQMGEALSHAHQNGVVHGDLRPHNIIVGVDGKLKVTDFGFSKAIASSALIQTNAMIRSVHYLSPERTEGAEATPASDLYSLGVVLYEMLTATVPFTGDNVVSVANKHVEERPVPPRNLNPSVPKPVEDLVLKSLQKSPAARHESAGRFVQDIRAIEAGTDSRPVIQWSSTQVERPPTLKPPTSIPREQMVAQETRAAAAKTQTGKRSLIVALVLVLVIGAFYAVWKITYPKEVEVPNIAGRKIAEAEVILKESGLNMKTMSEEYSDAGEADTVLRCIPDAGRKVKEGRTVFVVVSKGPELVPVPDLRDVALEKAKAILKQAGLTLGQVMEVTHETTPKGNVIAQAPEPNAQVKKGASVTLQVSKGAAVTTPSPEPTQPGTPTRKSARVNMTVPEGPDNQRVKIVVADDDGERTIYEENHSPGDKIRQEVSGTGDNVLVKVYINDKLVREKKLQ